MSADVGSLFLIWVRRGAVSCAVVAAGTLGLMIFPSFANAQISTPTLTPAPTVTTTPTSTLVPGAPSPVAATSADWLLVGLFVLALLVLATPIILTRIDKGLFDRDYIFWFITHYGIAALVLLVVPMLALTNHLQPEGITGLLGSLIGYVLGSAGRNRDSSGQPAAGASGLSVFPVSGTPGTTVSVRGTGFGTNRGAVTFGTTPPLPADIQSWSPTQLLVRVPAAARPGPVAISVTPAGTSTAITSASNAFTIEAPPTSAPPTSAPPTSAPPTSAPPTSAPPTSAASSIADVTPTSAAAGDPVTIKGTGFGANPGAVVFGTRPAQATDIQSWSPTEVVVHVPAGVTPGPVAIHVTPAGAPTPITSDPNAFTVK